MRIAVIPARGASRRIPNKNRRLFHGKPVIVYSIETAQSTRLFDKIVVTTDDTETAKIVMQAGAWAVWRAPEIAADEVGTQEVATQTVGLFYPFADEACVIYATAPLMAAQDIERGWRVLRDNKDIDYAFGVNEEPLFDAGQFYWARTKALLDRKPLIGVKTAMVPISFERVCDINVESDWLRAEQMYAALMEKQ